jgi:hypothetical protein
MHAIANLRSAAADVSVSANGRLLEKQRAESVLLARFGCFSTSASLQLIAYLSIARALRHYINVREK